jgi:hypothetical protein
MNTNPNTSQIPTAAATPWPLSPRHTSDAAATWCLALRVRELALGDA